MTFRDSNLAHNLRMEALKLQKALQYNNRGLTLLRRKVKDHLKMTKNHRPIILHMDLHLVNNRQVRTGQNGRQDPSQDKNPLKNLHRSLLISLDPQLNPLIRLA
jgi:hypothetical protein